MHPPDSPYPGARHPSNEIRLSPDGRVAQRLPDEMDKWGAHWISWAWPNYQLEVSLLSDEDVAEWTVLHSDDD